MSNDYMQRCIDQRTFLGILSPKRNVQCRWPQICTNRRPPIGISYAVRCRSPLPRELTRRRSTEGGHRAHAREGTRRSNLSRTLCRKRAKRDEEIVFLASLWTCPALELYSFYVLQLNYGGNTSLLYSFCVLY